MRAILFMVVIPAFAGMTKDVYSVNRFLNSSTILTGSGSIL